MPCLRMPWPRVIRRGWNLCCLMRGWVGSGAHRVRAAWRWKRCRKLIWCAWSQSLTKPGAMRDGWGDYYLTHLHGPSSAATSKATYLLRDTLKVTGSEALGLAPAVLGIFFVNEAEPSGGGTGHTIRVCGVQDVPVATQTEWGSWTFVAGAE